MGPWITTWHAQPVPSPFSNLVHVHLTSPFTLQTVDDGYRMPDSYDEPDKRSARLAAVTARYAEPEGGGRVNPHAEQEQWEAEQAKKARLRGQGSAQAGGKDYDYLFEDGMEFVKVRVCMQKCVCACVPPRIVDGCMVSVYTHGYGYRR